MADLPKPLPASEWQHDMWTADQLRAYAEQASATRVAQAVAQERERAAASPQPPAIPAGWPVSADERALRRLLAVRVAMPGLYLDDGEASGQQHGITIDFMREPVADIDAKLRALNVARAICAAPQPPSIVATTGYAQMIDGPKEPGLEWHEAPPSAGEEPAR